MSDPSDVVEETRDLLARIAAASVEHDAALLARAAFGGCIRLDDDAGLAAVHREQDALGALFTLGNDLHRRAPGLLSRLCDEVVALREYKARTATPAAGLLAALRAIQCARRTDASDRERARAVAGDRRDWDALEAMDREDEERTKEETK